MNDQGPSCNSRTEAISLLAAGCLTPEDERDLRDHLASCGACRRRFEQMSTVCDGLRKLKSMAGSFDASLLVSRTMAEIAVSGEATVAANLPGLSRSPSLLRWRLAACAMFAACLLLGLLWWSFFRATPHQPQIVRQEPRPGGLEQEPHEPVARPTVAATSPPTWLALRRAADQSDKAFDALLAQYSESLMTEPLSQQALLQESLQ